MLLLLLLPCEYASSSLLLLEQSQELVLSTSLLEKVEFLGVKLLECRRVYELLHSVLVEGVHNLRDRQGEPPALSPLGT